MKLHITNYELSTKSFLGFTLIELMIVVSILGILGAIVLPEFQSHTQQAKEAAAKDNLRILRETIERYANDHNGIPPGYTNNDPAQSLIAVNVYRQLVILNKYLTKMPDNPFNGYDGLKVYIASQNFPTEADGTSGWMYKPSTRELRLNWPGTDSQGIHFFDY
jgi:prepilin-type N-terminal cleavage/methylation domain-containing protein